MSSISQPARVWARAEAKVPAKVASAFQTGVMIEMSGAALIARSGSSHGAASARHS